MMTIPYQPPPGWRLVPEELTQEWAKAWADRVGATWPLASSSADMVADLLAAAPTQPEIADPRDKQIASLTAQLQLWKKNAKDVLESCQAQIAALGAEAKATEAAG